jgi:signal peptidase I
MSAGPSTPPPPARGPGWLLNLLLLFAVALAAALVPALLLAQEQFLKAGVAAGLGLLVGLALVLRPLFVRGPVRVAKAGVFLAAFLAFLMAAATLGGLVLFKAYVIPTGAMALGLPGYHRDVTCPQCGHSFAVNSSSEMAPRPGMPPELLVGCTCENCRYQLDFEKDKTASAPAGGTRVLMARFLTAPQLGEPDRYRDLIYVCPQPTVEGQHETFITRLVGLPGETLAIHGGHVYRGPARTHEETGVTADDRWQPAHMHEDDPRDLKAFREGRFEILRKPPAVMLALRRLVYDNDHPARDLEKVVPPRWQVGGFWKSGPQNSFSCTDDEGRDGGFVNYRHFLRPRDWPQGKDREKRPQLITDFLSYNSYRPRSGPERDGTHWVADLMLEFELNVTQARGKLRLQLAQGRDRFLAQWDLATGKCTLFRYQDELKEGERLAEVDTAVNKPGTYRIRFANFDERLTLWVNDELPLGDGVAYWRAWTWDAARQEFAGAGPTTYDLTPASVSSQGASLEVRHVQLWRNTYYTLGHVDRDAELPPGADDARAREDFWGDPMAWGPLRQRPVRTLYVQPGHYFVLGDNSPESYDSRSWGVVPERMLLGHALLVYYPLARAGRIY